MSHVITLSSYHPCHSSTYAQKNRLASGLANGDRLGGVQLLYGHAVSTGIAVPSATARHPSLEEPAEKGDLCDLRNMFVVVLVAFWVHFAKRPMTMTQEWSEWIGPVPQTENTISQTHQLAGGGSGSRSGLVLLLLSLPAKNVQLPIVILKKRRRVFLFTSLVNMGISSHGDLCCAERIFADLYRTCFICMYMLSASDPTANQQSSSATLISILKGNESHVRTYVLGMNTMHNRGRGGW